MQIMGVTQYADEVEAETFVLTAGASGRSGASGRNRPLSTIELLIRYATTLRWRRLMAVKHND